MLIEMSIALWVMELMLELKVDHYLLAAHLEPDRDGNVQWCTDVN